METFETDVLKGAAAGVLGGLVGAWVMNLFQAAWTRFAKTLQPEPPRGDGSSGGEDATMRTAAAIARAVLGRDPGPEEKRKAGPVVHYAFGAAMGGVYGAAVETTRRLVQRPHDGRR